MNHLDRLFKARKSHGANLNKKYGAIFKKKKICKNTSTVVRLKINDLLILIKQINRDPSELVSQISLNGKLFLGVLA